MHHTCTSLLIRILFSYYFSLGFFSLAVLSEIPNSRFQVDTSYCFSIESIVCHSCSIIRYKIESRFRKYLNRQPITVLSLRVVFSLHISILFSFRGSASNFSDTPTSTDPFCHMLSSLGSLSQSWFMLNWIIKGSEMPLQNAVGILVETLMFQFCVSCWIGLYVRMSLQLFIPLPWEDAVSLKLLYWLFSCYFWVVVAFILLSCCSSIKC